MTTPAWTESIGVVGPFPGHHAGGARATRRLIELADLRDGQRVLVVGCGDGATALRIAATRNVHVVGTDVNARAVDAARAAAKRSRVRGVVSFEVDDVLHSHLTPRSFDRVLVESVIIMLDKPRALASLASLLAPGGKLVISESTQVGQPARPLDDLEASFASVGIRWSLPSPDAWRAHFESAGLVVTDAAPAQAASLTWLGVSSWLHHPIKVTGVLVRIGLTSEARRFFWRTMRLVRRARIPWGYGIWVCEPRSPAAREVMDEP